MSVSDVFAKALRQQEKASNDVSLSNEQVAQLDALQSLLQDISVDGITAGLEFMPEGSPMICIESQGQAFPAYVPFTLSSQSIVLPVPGSHDEEEGLPYNMTDEAQRNLAAQSLAKAASSQWQRGNMNLALMRHLQR